MIKGHRTGYYVTEPSISQGNGFNGSYKENLSLLMIPTIDRAIVHYIIQSSEILETDDKDFIDT